MALGLMRRHKRWLFVFLWVVIAAFIVLYIPAFTSPEEGGAGEMLARVSGRAGGRTLTITAGEFQRAYFEQRQRMQQLYRGQLDAAMLRSLRIDEQVYRALVDRQIVRLEADRLGLHVDDATLAREIAASPSYQRDGRFIGADELRRLAALGGVPLEQIEQEFRESLLHRRLQELVGDAVVVSAADVEREYRRRNEQVRLEYVQVTASSSRVDVAVTDAQVQERFDARREAYRVPEKRVVSYLVVDPEALRPRVAVTGGEIEAYYRDRADEFREDEQVCASHVLVKVKAAPEAAEGHSDDEARRLAEGVLAKARAGADFAELARQSSEDQGSAPAGGDLGCFGRGRMLPEFENAAFDMQPGQTSELVRTTYGYHVIRVSARREETLPALKQVEERIRQALTAERLEALQAEKTDALRDALRAGRTLEQAAAEHGFSVQKSAPFAQDETPPAFASPQLVARAFTLAPGRSDPEGTRVRRGHTFVRLEEVQPPRLPELAEVRERVKADLIDEQAAARARAQAEKVRAAAESQGLEAAAKAAGLERRQTPELVGRGQPMGDLGSSTALDQAVFALPENTLSEPLRTPAGWAVVRVVERKTFDPAAFERERDALAAELREERQARLFQAYMQQARERYRVERRADVYKRVVG